MFEEFGEVETTQPYDGYFYSVRTAITISICGMFCGLQTMKAIHMWATHEKTKEFLKERFGIECVPCYSWYTQILGLIHPKSFSDAFTKWIVGLIGEVGDMTMSLDGKTVCSTMSMQCYDTPLHIVSAQLAELGITVGQVSVEGKSNEIPAVRQLLECLEIGGCMIVADAMHCQKETAEAVIGGGGDYLFSAKDNQPTLKAEIADFVQDDVLRGTMETVTKTEKNRDRIEVRTAYSTCEINWLYGREEWPHLACIGAINTRFSTKKGESDVWHYYISSRNLTAADLLDTARKEWSVESMHWLLDVRFGEDACRAAEQRTQENLNIIRKIILNVLRLYKTANNSKDAFSHLMLQCMIDPVNICRFAAASRSAN